MLGGEARLSYVVDGRVISADSVQIQVHGAEAGDAVHDVETAQRVKTEVLLLVAIEFIVLAEVFMRGQQESARAARRIVDGVAGFGRMTSTMARIRARE